MVFNWFRRKNTSEEDPNQPSETPEQLVESQSDADLSSAESSTDQEDYLAWAKTAYQNLQQRQQSEAPTENLLSETSAIEPVEAGPTEISASPDLAEAEPDSLTLADAEADYISIDAEISSEPTPFTEHTPEIQDSGIPATEPLEESTLETEPALPPPVSKTSPSPASPPSVPPTNPNLDEGFLWSAEVLAAQGRRPEEITVDEINWLQKLRKGLDKTRRGMVNQIKTIVGKGPLTPDAIADIEALLLQADVGVEATDTIIAALQQKMLKETLQPDAAIAYLKTILRDILDAPFQSQYSPVFAPTKNTLNLWLMTGVNGAGKTTTIGKIAYIAKTSGYSCLIAAADTFRAAAVEQVKIWGQRSEVDVIANPGQNTDPAAVVFDAITAAQSRRTELLLVDTAGRLQNKKNLMDELRKVRQIIAKKAPDAHIESLLVLDATLGQNGLRQAQVFSEAAQLSGVVLTKLDGSAKGGIALAVVQQLGLPIRFIGAGEGIQDLRPFSSYEFVEALLSN